MTNVNNKMLIFLKASLKHLEDMELDIKKSRKMSVSRDKYKSYNEKIEHELEGSDKWVMSKFGWTTILRPFLDIFERLPKTQNFFF